MVEPGDLKKEQHEAISLFSVLRIWYRFRHMDPAVTDRLLYAGVVTVLALTIYLLVFGS